MGMTRLILALLIGILLIGCSKNDTIEDKLLIDLPEKTDDIENTPSDTNNELPSDSSKEVDIERARPLELMVTSGDNTTGVRLDKYCWEKGEKKCNIEPDHPKELLEGLPPLKVKPGGIIDFDMNTMHPSIPFDARGLDNIEIIQYRKNEKSAYEVTGKNKTAYMTAPMEEGLYYYSVIVRWDGDTKGEAVYGFFASVR